MPYLAQLAVTGVIPAFAQNSGQGRGPIQSSRRYGDYRHRKNIGRPIRIGNTRLMINPHRITTATRFGKTSLFKDTESLAGRFVFSHRVSRHPAIQNTCQRIKKPRRLTVVRWFLIRLKLSASPDRHSKTRQHRPDQHGGRFGNAIVTALKKHDRVAHQF